MARIIVIHDGVVREDVLECEIFEGTFLVTAQDNEQRNGEAVTILLDERGAKRLRQHLDQYFNDYPTRQVAQLQERLDNAEQQVTEWRALANIYAEGKDLLRRELDQLQREEE